MRQVLWPWCESLIYLLWMVFLFCWGNVSVLEWHWCLLLVTVDWCLGLAEDLMAWMFHLSLKRFRKLPTICGAINIRPKDSERFCGWNVHLVHLSEILRSFSRTWSTHTHLLRVICDKGFITPKIIHLQHRLFLEKKEQKFSVFHSESGLWVRAVWGIFKHVHHGDLLNNPFQSFPSVVAVCS